MAGIIYELIDVLEEQKECYEGLNTLATYTENAVINKNIEFLQEVVKTEEQFIGRINNLEKKRESLMQDIDSKIDNPPIYYGDFSKGLKICQEYGIISQKHRGYNEK